MQTGVLITDGGPHPAEKWAAATAGQIIKIGADASGEQAIAARKFELKIIDILEEHHGKVQTHERGKITEHGTARLSHDCDPTDHVSGPVSEIIEASKGTVFEAHFAKTEIQEYVRSVVHQHFGTSMHNERSWFADEGPTANKHRAKHLPGTARDPNCPHIKAFRERSAG